VTPPSNTESSHKGRPETRPPPYQNARWGYGKSKPIPTIQSLKEEYAILDKEKRGLYNGYGKQRDDTIALKLARQNVDMFLDETRERKLLERLQTHGRGAR